MRLGREDVDGVHLGVLLAAVLDALDIWASFSGAQGSSGMARERTGDMVVEDVIFAHGAVDDPLGALVDNQDFPLEGCAQQGQLGVGSRPGGRG